MVGAFERPFRGTGIDFSQIPQGDSDQAFEARRAMAARLLMGRSLPRIVVICGSTRFMTEADLRETKARLSSSRVAT